MNIIQSAAVANFTTEQDGAELSYRKFIEYRVWQLCIRQCSRHAEKSSSRAWVSASWTSMGIIAA